MNHRTVAVVGAGTMGVGIAQLAASHGWSVQLVDADASVLTRATANLQKQLSKQAEAGKITEAERDAVLGRIHTAHSIPRLEPVSLAIEAVIENLDVKQGVFRALEDLIGLAGVLATNTSSLSVSQIARAIRDPGRVIGMHFFNPAPVMPLVEIIAGKESQAAALNFGTQIAREWGKVTVAAKDTPGFIVNRVARGFYLEALRLLGEGVAGIDEIDAVMRTHGGFKMGPFQLMDLVGLDVNLAVSTSVWEQMGKPARLAPHPIQQALVAQGHLGRKTKRGFYAYEDSNVLPAYPVERKTFGVSPLFSDAIRVFSERSGAPHAGSTEQYILARILSAILNEAAFALGEGVASAEDIDLAMVKGTNYPKGPLAWAEQIGPRTVRGVLVAFNRTFADGRYQPAPMFV